jgi:DNA invertase Pin-like site-specific DNA recombinase
MQRAFDSAWRGNYEVLIVWVLDRLTREGAEGALRIVRQFRERWCIVVSVKENGGRRTEDSGCAGVLRWVGRATGVEPA